MLQPNQSTEGITNRRQRKISPFGPLTRVPSRALRSHSPWDFRFAVLGSGLASPEAGGAYGRWTRAAESRCEEQAVM